MIEAHQLVKTFGIRPVLRGVDLEIKRGECVALLGANGSGKTTLIRILATLSRPTRGTVQIGGWTLPKEARQVRPHLGYLGHLPLIYDDLTAAENLLVFAHLYGISPDLIPPALARVGLGKRAKDQAGAFSRGMQQRLGIARALLHQPDVLLFDEPYTGLDVDGTQMLDDIIQEQKAAGRTILITSHDLERTLRQSERILILNRGIIAREVVSGDLTPVTLAQVYAEALR
jgi:heme ABC exporter ATP-binding subunit CcmA